METNYVENVLIFKALADETRIKIVEILTCGEMCACKLLESFNITQPTLSYHMKILTECGLTIGRRDGAWMRYSINQEKATQIREFLTLITTENCNNTCTECVCE